jgi:membrane protease subunit (stomatin/prohibitin family)
VTNLEFLFAWMQTPNPMLGDVTPLWMMEHGKGEKLARFMRQAYEDNCAADQPEAARSQETVCGRCGEPTFSCACGAADQQSVTCPRCSGVGTNYSSNYVGGSATCLLCAGHGKVIPRGDGSYQRMNADKPSAKGQD